MSAHETIATLKNSSPVPFIIGGTILPENSTTISDDLGNTSANDSDSFSHFTSPPASSGFVEEFHDDNDYSAFANYIFANQDALSLRGLLDTVHQGWNGASRMAANLSFTSSHSDSLPSQNAQKRADPMYDVFLGGSCGNTVWRSEVVIPYLKKRSITYYDPQRPTWSENLIYEEMIAKENSRLFLFVLDPGTINATSFLEIAYLAARKASKLVVVFIGKREWSDKAHPMDLPDRIRTCNLLEAILTRHSVPMLTSIEHALDYVDEMIIGEKSWRQAMSTPLQRVPFLQVRSRRLLKNSSKSCKNLYSHVRNRVGCYSRRVGLLLLCETIVVLGLIFLVSYSIPLWMLLLPFLAFDYLLLIGAVIYYRFKVLQKRKLKTQSRKIVIPGPPVPRVGPTALAGTGSGNINSPSGDSQLQGRRKISPTLMMTHSPLPICDNYSQKSTSRNMKSSVSVALLLDSLDMVDTEIRKNELERAQENRRRTSQIAIVSGPRQQRRISLNERIKSNRCLSSPVGYDVFLSCSSSSELDWITQKAVPQLHKSGLSYTSALMCDKEMRIPLLHTASHILYYIPSYKTFLSGMIEIAYFIGHSDWQVTVCVPREAECLILLDNDSKCEPETLRAVQRRNECYRMAFCYLKDMAQRRQCRVFTKVEDAVKHIADKSKHDQESKAHSGLKLRQIVEKQHLVKERTRVNLLKHMQEMEALKQQSAVSNSNKQSQ
ncbi:nucleoside 2-deoxyribosyltransferase like domain-containing protein [Ditylenchus destructor]|uniref:Nucleoside 2-deoxyribosyltransferase like domain-containing protein n=1 Tax=Ditylenchus destructor TaxID=166010 RepID=A0AAD4MXU2_9BILA|nr:nucleoside 2-deoxyribosyltransferase like domain-containing protein [Ditylenchus destructor]